MRKQNKTITLSIIVAAILTLYIFGWANPKLKRYRQINNDLQQKQIQLEKYQALLLNKNEYHRKTLVLKNELKRIKDSLYVSSTPLIATSELLGNLETISKNTRVNIINQNILKAKKTGRYEQLFVMLNLQTNPEGLTKFLYALKTANKLYSIPYLNIFVQEDNKLRVGIIISSFMVEG